MYTSYIGKKFLKLYNEREGKSLSAEEFFNDVIYPLFFDDDKHFLNVANSSFFQSVSKEQLNEGKSVHQIKLERFHKNVQEDGASLTTLVGYAAQGITAGTSGQLSNLKTKIDSEEMYASWIGVGLAIAMGGGYSMLIDENEIMLALFEGWYYYRKALKQTPNLKGNQIDVWNSYWLCHRLSKNYDLLNPLDRFTIPEPMPCKSDKWKKMGLVEFETNNWIKVIFSLSKKSPLTTFTINAFKFADTNQTLGFINLFLPSIHRLYEMKDYIFISEDSTILKEEEIDNLSTFYNFKNACKFGTIGLKAIEPLKLREYMPLGSVLYAQGKEYKFSNEESYIKYKLFKIWIIAMLNKTELLSLASNVAGALSDFEKPDDRGKKVLSTLSQEVRESNNLKAFIDKLTEVLNHAPSNADVFKDVVEQVLKMPTDNFPLFVTLIRFEYAYLKSKN